jgi:recombinational DNA repair protein (RecF pathway)
MSDTNLLSEKLARGIDVAVPAIVLRARPFRDNDLMAQLLTPSLGKVSVIGRHARGSKKRFPSSLDLFDRGTARLAREKSGSICVKEFTPSHSLVRVRGDLDKLTLASLLCESFDLVLQENSGEDASEVFEVLDLSLNAIDESSDVRTALRASLVALITLTRREGIIDLSSHPPGSRALHAALSSIERFSERKLATRSSIDELIARLAR